MRVNTVIEPESSCLEKLTVMFLTAFTFIPLGIGVLYHISYLCLSLPIGMFFIFLFNVITKGKFQPKNWIQESYIEFSDQGFIYCEKESVKKYMFDKVEDFKIELKSFEGQIRSVDSEGDTSRLNGTENLLAFRYMGAKIKYQFYLKEKEDKKDLLRLFIQGLGQPHIAKGELYVFISESKRGKTFTMDNIDPYCVELIH